MYLQSGKFLCPSGPFPPFHHCHHSGRNIQLSKLWSVYRNICPACTQICAPCTGMYCPASTGSGKLVRWKSWNSLDNRGLHCKHPYRNAPFYDNIMTLALSTPANPSVEIYNSPKNAQECVSSYVVHSGKLVWWKSWNSLDNRGGGIWGLANTFFSKEVEREKHNVECQFVHELNFDHIL